MENTEKKNTGFIVLVIVLVIMVIGLTSYIVYDKVMDSKSDNVTVKINKNDENDNIEKLGKDLFEKFTAFKDYEPGEFIYSSENLNYITLSNDYKLVMAMLNSKDIVYNKNFSYDSDNEEDGVILDYYSKIKITDLEKSYKDLFGMDKTLDLSVAYEDDSNYAYKKFPATYWDSDVFIGCKQEDDDFVCYGLNGGGIWSGQSFYQYDYSKMENEKLYVYVNHLAIDAPSEFRFCSDYICENIIDDTEYTNEDLEDINNFFEKYKGKTGVYKLVFAKDTNDNWYWEETQIIKR